MCTWISLISLHNLTLVDGQVLWTLSSCGESRIFLTSRITSKLGSFPLHTLVKLFVEAFEFWSLVGEVIVQIGSVFCIHKNWCMWNMKFCRTHWIHVILYNTRIYYVVVLFVQFGDVWSYICEVTSTYMCKNVRWLAFLILTPGWVVPLFQRVRLVVWLSRVPPSLNNMPLCIFLHLGGFRGMHVFNALPNA